MINRIFLTVSFCCFVLVVNAQEIKQNLELLQTTVSGDSLLITGFKPNSSNQKFVVSMYNKTSLALIGTYEKSIDPGAKRYFVERIGSTFRFSFYNSTNKMKYRISTDLALKELFAGLPVEKENTDENVDEVGEWTYGANYSNDYLYGNYMLDIQLTEITCYSQLDPLDGTYRMKWEMDFNDGENYQKVELLNIIGNTAYFFVVNVATANMQKILSVDMVTGKEIFNRQLNGMDKTDSIKAFGVSNIYADGKNIYLAGTYMADDPDDPYPFLAILDGKSKERGYEAIDPYIIYSADGYFIMSLNAESGNIEAMSVFTFPSVDKTVDNRDYRTAVCPGIAPLSNGKFVAFFEQYSCMSQIAADPYSPKSGRTFGDEMNPDYIKWGLDAFTSVVFDNKLSDVSAPTTTLWEDENTTYALTDFDMFSLNVQAEYPHSYITIGDDGCYPHQFICDGTNWTFIVRCDDDKSPDYLLKGNENEQKVVKLLNSGILYPLSPDTMVEQKDGESSTTIKVVKH